MEDGGGEEGPSRSTKGEFNQNQSGKGLDSGVIYTPRRENVSLLTASERKERVIKNIWGVVWKSWIWSVITTPQEKGP